MQLRYKTDLTREEYVNRRAWGDATLERCPRHPQGGCSFARHGTYRRVNPPGTLIARWYCPESHCTFSLLPDCFAARLTGSLAQVEATVRAVEQTTGTEAAADLLRPDIDLPGAVRWTRRRLEVVRATLTILLGLLPGLLAGCQPTLGSFGQRPGTGDRGPGTGQVLVALREIAAGHLPLPPPPLGFKPPARSGGEPGGALQQRAGPDPPVASA